MWSDRKLAPGLGKNGLLRRLKAHTYKGQIKEAKDVSSSCDAMGKVRLDWRDDPNIRVTYPLGTSVLGSV